MFLQWIWVLIWFVNFCSVYHMPFYLIEGRWWNNIHSIYEHNASTFSSCFPSLWSRLEKPRLASAGQHSDLCKCITHQPFL
jgi:hypothetical protein